MTRTQKLRALRRRLLSVDRTIRELQRLQKLDLLRNPEISGRNFGQLLAMSQQPKSPDTINRMHESPPGCMTAKILLFPAAGKRVIIVKESPVSEDAKNA